MKPTSRSWAFRAAFLVLVFCLCTSSSLPAQTGTGQISGTVEDPQGAVVPKASVTIVNKAQGVTRTAQSNSTGFYSAPFLPVGVYRLTVQASGFQTTVADSVVLHVGDLANINFRLKVGSETETVTVEGGAPLVNTQDATVSTVVDREFAENLPMNGRSFQTLLSLTPGVVFTPASELNPGQVSINGQRADANYFTVDGVSANIGVANSVGLQQSGGSLPQFSVFGGTNSLVSVDAMQEFRIQTSSFAPEFGRQPGGQISIVTRSGTNTFHGTAFDYLRNDVFDANDWFTNSLGLRKPAERQNDFGGTLGGPIWKDRLFFFFSYEGLRLRQPKTAITDVPSSTARASAATSIQPLIAGFPIPNGPNRLVNGAPNGMAEFHASFSNPTTLNATSMRFDATINPSLTAFARYNYSPSSADQRGGQFGSSLNTTAQLTSTTNTTTAGVTARLSASMTDELHGNYSYVRTGGINSLDSFGGAVVPSDALLFPPPFSHDIGSFQLMLTYGQRSNYRYGKDVENSQYQFNIIDNLSWALHSHTLKIGLDYRRISPGLGVSPYVQIPFLTSNANVLSGVAPFVTIAARSGNNGLLYNNISTYMQDSWKTSQRLTVVYGVRWDINPAPTERHGRSLPVLDNLQTPSAISLASSGSSLYETTLSNFAPRAGIALRALGSADHQLVFRVGAGLFYDLGTEQTGSVLGAFPFSTSRLVLNGSLPLNATAAAPPAIPASLPARPQVNAFDRHLNLPRIYQWNAALEQALGSHQSVSVTYAGALGRRLLATNTIINSSAQNANFPTVILTQSGATSDYHSMQLQYQRRVAGGLEALASFAWSHSIDEISDDTATSGKNLARGSSDFDIRRVFTGAVNYQLPSIKTNHLTKAIFGGWTASSYVNARSSLPVDVLTNSNTLIGTQQVTVRPNVVAGQPFYLTGQQCASFFQASGALAAGSSCPGGSALNPAAFVKPTGGQGNFGRNVVRGFPAFQLDFALQRTFPIREHLSVQCRTEWFNLLNHPNFANPVNTLNTATFGLSTQTLAAGFASGGAGLNSLYQVGGPRSGQFALKLTF